MDLLNTPLGTRLAEILRDVEAADVGVVAYADDVHFAMKHT